MTLDDVAIIYQRAGIQGVIDALGDGNRLKTGEVLTELLRREKNGKEQEGR